MDFAKVNIAVRTELGKGGARKVRRNGKVPGILYGHKQPPVPVSFVERDLLVSLDKEKRRNTVFSLTLTGNGKAEEITAMIRDVEVHPVERRLVHVDFQRVSPDEEVHVSVPLALLGKAIGVTNGGNLHQSVHDIAIAALPGAIPASIELDVSALDLGDALHVSDLRLGTGVRALLDPKTALASVVAPRQEKLEAEAAPTETAAPAETAQAGEEDRAAGETAPGAKAAAAKPGASEKKGK